jgi:hypothetical protein
VLEIVPGGKDLAERPRPRGVVRALHHVRSSGRGVDERADGVRKQLLRGVRPERVQPDAGGEDAARVEEQVQVPCARCGPRDQRIGGRWI